MLGSSRNARPHGELRDDPYNDCKGDYPQCTLSWDSAKLLDETDTVTSDSSPVISQSKREMRDQESEERWKRGKRKDSFVFLLPIIPRAPFGHAVSLCLFILHLTDAQGRNQVLAIKSCPYLGGRDNMKFTQVSLGLGNLSLKKEVQVP